MNTIHHRGVNSYLDQEYKTKAIPKYIIIVLPTLACL